MCVSGMPVKTLDTLRIPESQIIDPSYLPDLGSRLRYDRRGQAVEARSGSSDLLALFHQLAETVENPPNAQAKQIGGEGWSFPQQGVIKIGQGQKWAVNISA
jgi:hypothetical protein